MEWLRGKNDKEKEDIFMFSNVPTTHQLTQLLEISDKFQENSANLVQDPIIGKNT